MAVYEVDTTITVHFKAKVRVQNVDSAFNAMSVVKDLGKEGVLAALKSSDDYNIGVSSNSATQVHEAVPVKAKPVEEVISEEGAPAVPVTKKKRTRKKKTT